MGLWVLKFHLSFFYCLCPGRQKLQNRVKANPDRVKDIFPTRWNKNILWPCLVVCLCWCISWNLFFNKSLITLSSSNKWFNGSGNFQNLFVLLLMSFVRYFYFPSVSHLSFFNTYFFFAFRFEKASFGWCGCDLIVICFNRTESSLLWSSISVSSCYEPGFK